MKSCKLRDKLPMFEFEFKLDLLEKQSFKKWVSVSSTDKVSDGCIRDLGFNHCLHQKLIGVLV